MQPLENLLGTELRLAQPDDVRRQGVQRHIRDTDSFTHAGEPPLYNNEFLLYFRSRMAAKKTIRSGFVGQKYRAQRRDIYARQGYFRCHNTKIRVRGKKFLHLCLIFLHIHCTGRIHQTAVFGKRIRAVLQNFLLRGEQILYPVQILVTNIRLFGNNAQA